MVLIYFAMADEKPAGCEQESLPQIETKGTAEKKKGKPAGRKQGKLLGTETKGNEEKGFVEACLFVMCCCWLFHSPKKEHKKE